MDHISPEIEFVHDALGDTPVTVKQSLEPLEDGRDATARLVWDGAAPMATFLCEHPELVRDKTVVELGAGPGLPGIVAARLGAKRVVLTDLPSELELPRLNAACNAVGDVCSAKPCTWGDENAIEKIGKKFDVVLCSDVLYGHRAEIASALANTAHALCCSNNGRVFLSYFPREKLEHDQPFFRRCDALFEDPKQRSVGGCAGDDEDLWFFEYQPKKIC